MERGVACFTDVVGGIVENVENVFEKKLNQTCQVSRSLSKHHLYVFELEIAIFKLVGKGVCTLPCHVDNVGDMRSLLKFDQIFGIALEKIIFEMKKKRREKKGATSPPKKRKGRISDE